MHLNVLPNENFSCQCCAKCCHHWHVAFQPGEIETIEALDWPDEHADLRGIAFTQDIKGDKYLKHAADDACVFLNRETGLCRIHDVFGEDAKPLGCRVFPFHITSPFPGQIHVTGRCDCPTIRQNEGKPHAEHRNDILRYAKSVKLRPFSDRVMAGLARPDIERITRFIAETIEDMKLNDERALFMHFFLNYLEANEKAPRTKMLNDVVPAMRELIDNTLDTFDEEPPTSAAQVAFRGLLATYLRRDEDVVDGRAGRLQRTAAIYRTVRGKGNFRELGVNHKRGNLKDAKLFRQPFDVADEHATDLLWRVVCGKLRALQFMGDANLGADIFSGLRSLSLFYPLVIAVAKYSQAAEDKPAIDADDIDYAVEAIEHSFGRSKVLATTLSRRHEAMLSQQEHYVPIVLTM